MTTLSKILTPPDVKPSRPAAQKPSEQWAEACWIFPIYSAIAKQLGVNNPFAPKRSLPENPNEELFKEVHAWLDQIDEQVQVHQLRQLLQTTTLNASEESLRAVILRHLRKPAKTNTDRDKIDFLLVQYFALCAPAKIYHKQIELADVALVMKPVLGEVDTKPLEWCAPLEQMIEELRSLRSLREILKTTFIEQGRRVKESAGGMFYDAPALLAFTRFNFLLRRTLIELMHADLIAIRAVLGRLEAAKVRAMDCTAFGLSATEPLAKIRQIADTWKQPFQREYTERTVSQAFEKLLGLRSAVESALERAGVKTGELAVSPLHTAIAHPEAPGAPPITAGKPSWESAAFPQEAAAPFREPATESHPPELDFDSCMEQIWEQLIATPPSRGRSMSTIKIGPARILLSSWEVTAFLNEKGQAAEDLRRAVAARALVTAAVESAKESGNATALERVLEVARAEVSRLQERLDVAKRAKDTEAAVNLGISTKRLIFALSEAEKL